MDELEQLLKAKKDILQAMDAAPQTPPPQAVTALRAALANRFAKRTILTQSQMQFFILKLLADGMLDGVEIIRKLNRYQVTLANHGEGLIYGILNQAETKGWIESEWRESSAVMTKFYRITQKGTHQLSREKNTAAQLDALFQKGIVLD